MRLILTALAALFGLIAGGFVAYLIYFFVYPVYANYHPLDASAECSRGNGVAYLSIFAGALLGLLFLPFKVWRHY